IFARSAFGEGAEEPILRSSALLKDVDDITPDGRTLMITLYGPTTGGDLWLLPLDGDRKPVPWLRTPSFEGGATISPSGRWVCYGSDESGEAEIYVRPFKGGGPRIQVSRGGGDGVAWRADGREIMFGARGRLWVADVREVGSQIEISEPRTLFTLP